MPIAKPIPNQAALRKLFDYNPTTGDLFWLESGNKAGSLHYSGYVSVQVNKQRYQAHRIIWALCYGSIPQNMMIDHIDRNRSNNRLDNLRLADDSENQYNRTANKGREVKGVYRHNRLWKAEITADGKRKYLGLFKTPEAAYEAYKKAAKELHGNHVRV